MSIANSHAVRIQGMGAVFKTLISMDYLREGDIHFPSANSERATANIIELRAAGFSQDALTIVEQLPYLNQALIYRWSGSDTGVQIAPSSQVVTYRSGCLPKMQDLRTVCNVEAQIGENSLKIARAGR